MDNRRLRPWIVGILSFTWTVMLLPLLQAAPNPKLDELRHARQQRRIRDDVFRKQIIKLGPTQALDIYKEVLGTLRTYYVHADQVEPAVLFQLGLDEFRAALKDEVFVKEFLSKVADSEIKDFLTSLNDWPKVKIETELDAKNQVESVARKALAIKLKASVVVLEFAFGACNSLDEYTFPMTPRQFRDLEMSLNGKYVGIGVTLAPKEQKVVIHNIAVDSPALGRLQNGDTILSIDGRDVTSLKLADATERLLGNEGTSVELEVASPMEAGKRVVKVSRGVVALPSVSDNLDYLEEGIGYIRVHRFQETTVQDMKLAILNLQSRGMKVLVLDLRGNPGGLFEAGVQAAELFLSDGVIVYTQGRFKEQSRKAHNPNALNIPIVVMVDGDTASSAEILAGALKDNNRATVMGQTTYGKGSMQDVMPLTKFPDKNGPAGLRITVATFLSPAYSDYNGRGVTPNIPLETSDLNDPDLKYVRREAKRLLNVSPMAVPMMMQ